MTKLARLQDLNNSIGANATLVVYDGLYPASPDVTTAANTLVTFACDPTSFGNVSVMQTIIGNTITNVVTLVSTPFPPVLSSSNGIAAWARISNAAGNAIVDMDVGLANSGTSIVMNETVLIANIPVQIVSVNISEQ